MQRICPHSQLLPAPSHSQSILGKAEAASNQTFSLKTEEMNTERRFRRYQDTQVEVGGLLGPSGWGHLLVSEYQSQEGEERIEN